MKGLDVPASYRRPDGVWEHYIRQSDLVRVQMCPEQHRLTLLGQVPDNNGDASIIGSGCHESYAWFHKLVKQRLAEGQEMLHPEVDYEGAMCSVARDYITPIWDGPTHRQSFDYASVDDALDAAYECIGSFWYGFAKEGKAPYLLDIDSVEEQFKVLIYEDDKRRVWACGTWDLGLGSKFHYKTIDFKHSAKNYVKDKWKLERYNVQGYLYVMIRRLLDGVEVWELDPDTAIGEFEFVNVRRDDPKRTIEVIPLVVEATHCLDIHDRMMSLAYLIEAEAEQWPMGASDWWCSPAWCPAWGQCRGKNLGDDPWDLMRKKREKVGK